MIYPLNAAEILHLMVVVLSPHTPGAGEETSDTITSTYLLGLVLVLVGTIIRVAAIHQLGPDFAYLLSLRAEHKLVTRGLYSIVRHPSYTGGVLIMVASHICQLGPGSHWAVTLGPAWLKYALGGLYILTNAAMFIALPGRMQREDEVLHRVYGKKWEEWAARTRYKLVPYVI